jgi:hypothetical protein
MNTGPREIALFNDSRIPIIFGLPIYWNHEGRSR